MNFGNPSETRSWTCAPDDIPKLARCIPTFALLVAAALLSGCGTTGGPTVSVPPAPRLPAPVGFVDGAGVSPRMRDMALAAFGGDNEVLGFYVRSNKLSQLVANQGWEEAPQFCAALRIGCFESRSAADQAFEKAVGELKKNGKQLFDPNGPHAKEA
jgi:hypothetical protein